MPDAPPAPLPDETAAPALVNGAGFSTLKQWQDERSVCAMVVLKDGVRVYEDYFHNTHEDDLRISWSMAKSILSATLGVMWDRGLVPDLDIDVAKAAPMLRGSAYEGVTLRQVLNMASGVTFNEDYLDYHSDINRMGRLLAVGGSMDKFAAAITGRDWAAGTYSRYCSIDTHVIGMVMRGLSGRSTAELVQDLVLGPLGLERAPFYLTDSKGEPFVLGGLNMTTRDFARFGLMFANGGVIDGRRIVSQAWVDMSTQASAPLPPPEKAGTPEADLRYGFQWWKPRGFVEGEFYAIGIYGQFIYVNRDAGVVIAVNSADRDFRVGDGAVAAGNIAMFRAIANAL